MKLNGKQAVILNLPMEIDFEDVVREHQAMVFRTLTRLTGSREHVEDLAQEVFLRLYRALPAFRGDSLLATYIYRVTVNVAQDEWKRRRRTDRPLVSISEKRSCKSSVPLNGPSWFSTSRRNEVTTRSHMPCRCRSGRCERICIAVEKSSTKPFKLEQEAKGEHHERDGD